MKTFSLNFFLRKSTGKNQETNRLFGRITVASKRVDFSLNRLINAEDWDQKRSKLRSRTNASKELEKYLATISETFYKIERELIEKDISITAQTLYEAYIKQVSGKINDEEKEKTIGFVFDLHINQLEELSVTGQINSKTVYRYKATKGYFLEFIKSKYQSEDISLKSLTYSLGTEFDHFLRTKKNCAHNTTVKYLKNLKKIIRLASDYGWLQKNPFALLKTTSKTVNRLPLDSDELSKIENAVIDIPRLNNVRNYFLFSCYTGLSCSDLMSLKSTDISVDNCGDLWILKPRKKTDVLSRIYLLEKAKAIMDQYKDCPPSLKQGTIFPQMSNQKLNSYLKELADICKIKREITFHLARYTFATTVTLANGVSLESIMCSLGHNNIRQTQQYAKMANSRIKVEMQAIDKHRISN